MPGLADEVLSASVWPVAALEEPSLAVVLALAWPVAALAEPAAAVLASAWPVAALAEPVAAVPALAEVVALAALAEVLPLAADGRLALCLMVPLEPGLVVDPLLEVQRAGRDECQ